jgi:protein TonB
MAAATIEKPSLGALSRAGIVVAMHAAALFVFARAFGLVPGVTDIPPEIELARVPDEIKTDDQAPKPEYRAEYDTTVQVPKPEILLEFDLGETAITAELVEPDKIDFEKGTAEVKPALVGVMRDPRNPPTQPPYPAEMIRLGKEAVVDVEVLVNPDGRVAAARVLNSSGFSAFDRVTLEEARRKWRFKPATRDGVPYAQWTRQRVVFQLKNP